MWQYSIHAMIPSHFANCNVLIHSLIAGVGFGAWHVFIAYDGNQLLHNFSDNSSHRFVIESSVLIISDLSKLFIAFTLHPNILQF
jgi:hypothetical protein